MIIICYQCVCSFCHPLKFNQ